jgi:O-antigen/teichoic acid export membrane protein
MLQYAYPVMITGVAGMINEMFSRSMLDWWLPEKFYADTTREEAGGIFGACYKFAVFMNLGIQAFRYAAEPFFFSNAADKNSPALFAKVNHYFVVACCVVLLGISINMGVFKFMIGEEFWAGISIVPILLLAYLFLGIYYNMSVWFKLTDKTYYGTLITLLGALITVVGNFILIPIAGYMGSSVAALLCYFTMAVACYLVGQRYYPIPYSIIKDLAYIIITYSIILIVTNISFVSLWANVGFHSMVIILFCGGVFLIERKSLMQPVA